MIQSGAPQPGGDDEIESVSGDKNVPEVPETPQCPYCHRHFRTQDDLTLHIVTRHTRTGAERGLGRA